ncbi:STAS domain-containing protein [Planococcus ruber]|uniref:STAS domain-containing protein n=1 Tax=Planococcus ruber TaxID=2027871 RepID=UPI001FEFE0C5|nr:STAS domain-containing protein [Planococcus ruber]MCJ1909984.1 STAS domain-containing protein [Planococcus ruber]
MTKKQLTVGDVDLQWDLEKAEVLFDGGDVVFFWISAMETFFDSIREIAGTEATKLVLETTGFRQGVVVGEEFLHMKNISTSNIIEWLANTYAPAGWGKVKIVKMDEETKQFTFHIQDDWEYKMNQRKQKGLEGIFVHAHYAGVLTGLFGTNFWYKTIQYQNNENPYSIVEYYPSDITVQSNIHDLSRKQEALKIQELERMVDEKTMMLQKLIKEISSPIIPVLENIVVVPMIGNYDEERSEDLILNTLSELPRHRAHYLLLDLTGLHKHISEHTARLIDKLGASARLLGIETILVGVSPELAMVIAQSENDLNKFECLKSLQHGIYYALGKSGRTISKAD